MTLILSTTSTRVVAAPTATESPWNTSTTPCITPTPDGSGATIHPSVVDMGRAWRGYRWWMANTPYPGGVDDLENPCILASNDRRTWSVPAGLINPLDPNPGNPQFHSDTELTYDPDAKRLIVFYRRTESGGPWYLMAQSSPDGVTWTNHGVVLEFASSSVASPTVWRAGDADWRMWTYVGGFHMRSATDPLGTWGASTPCTLDGGWFTAAWHGDVIRYGGRWIAAYSTGSSTGIIKAASSSDGVNWSDGGTIFTGTDGGWATTPYRPTLAAAPESSFVDCWYGAFGSVPGGCATDYVRLPDTLWPAT